MREIIKLPEKFKLSEATLELNHLADYAYELSKVFNKFYSNNKIINTDSELMTFRLQLTKQTNHTLKFVFNVLGIRGCRKTIKISVMKISKKTLQSKTNKN